MRPLTWLFSILLLAGPAAQADTTVKLINKSAFPWLVRVVPNGRSSADQVEVGGAKIKFWKTFDLKKGETVSAKFLSSSSKDCVRFQLIDRNGNWIEMVNDTGAGKTTRPLYSNLPESDFSKLATTFRFNSPAKGDVTIEGGAASEGFLAETRGDFSLTETADTIEPPFIVTYLFNQASSVTQPHKLALVASYGTAEKVPNEGELYFTDVNGKQLARSPLKDDIMELPPNSNLRMIFKPNNAKKFHKEFFLIDGLGKQLALVARADETGHGILASPHQKLNYINWAAAPPEGKPRFVRLNNFAEGDLTVMNATFCW
jgi:hypothetical protein